MFNFMQKTFTSVQATTLYGTGCLNLGFKRYSTAIEYFTQAIALDSKYADAFYQRSIAFKEMGEQQKAISDFQQAVELNPKLLDALLAAAKTDMDLKLYSLAIRRFDHVLEMNPRLDKIFIQRASAKCALKKYKEAIKDYDEAIKLKPEEHTYCGRGNVKASLGLYDEAIADYQQALQLNPQSTSALLNRGIVAYNLGGKYHQAFIDFSNVLKLDPKHPLALYYLGLVNLDLGNYEDADINIGISIEIQKNHPNAYCADAYIARGIVRQLISRNLQPSAPEDFANAYSLIQIYTEHEFYDVEAWIKLFILHSSYKYNDSWNEMIVGFENCCFKGTSLPTPASAALGYYYLARAYEMRREFAIAEENFLKSIKLEENSRVYYEYAHFLARQKKRTLAISKLQRALELSADGECITYYRLFSSSLTKELQNELEQSPRLSMRVSVLARWWLIKCYLAEGEKNNAEQQLDNLLKAVEDFPSPIAYSLLGYAYQALEQWHLAARSFKTAFLLRTNYSLARQNLKKCLNQLSVHENEIKPFEIIAQIQQLLVSKNSKPIKQEQESTIRSTHSPQLSDNKKQEIDKQTATERSKLNPKQHSSYESMSNRTSSEAKAINEIKSATYYEFYQLTDSHKSGEQLLKLPMEGFVDNKKQKSSQQKSETETEAALPLVQNLPNQSKEEDEEELDDGQDNRFQI